MVIVCIRFSSPEFTTSPWGSGITALNYWPVARLWDLIILCRGIVSISLVSSPQSRAPTRRNTKSMNIKNKYSRDIPFS